MKKLSFLLSGLIAALSIYAQVTSDPAVVYIGDQTKEFKIIFDATKGDGGMKGQTSCYIHTGLITDKSSGDSDWKHATNWGDNADKYKMTKVDTNIWEITITGGINSYYKCSSTEIVKKLAFVFRNSNGSKQSEDLFYALTDPYEILDIKNGDLLFTGDPKQHFAATSHDVMMDSLSLVLSTGGNSAVYEKKDANEITIDTVLVSTGSYKLVFKAFKKESEEMVKKAERSVSFTVKNPPVRKPKPEYLKEGINYLEGSRVGLVLRAPGKASVNVIGDFNNWDASNADYTMYLDDIYWWIEFDLPSATEMYGFQYIVDNTIKVSDPYSEYTLDPWNDPAIDDRMDPALPPLPAKGKYDGCVGVLRHTNPSPYVWNDEDWVAPDKKDLVIYELCMRDFANKIKTKTGGTPGTWVGSLAEVYDKLDYIQNLGINAIELMPVTEFDDNASWGYNPNHFFAADKAYGTVDEYKAFIDTCHNRGIAVILDMVFNHVTGNHAWFKLYRSGDKPAKNNPWLNEEAPHPFSVFNDVNHEYEGSREYFKRCLQYWLKEYHVDGFRMDLAKGFSQKKVTEKTCSNYDASRIAILKDYADAIFEVNPDAYYILEYFVDNNEEKEMSKYGALPWRNMNYNYGQAVQGQGSDSHFVDSNGKGGMFEDGWVGYCSSHDEERNFYRALTWGKGNMKTNEAVRLARVPLYIAFATLFPGPKMIWQFDEMGYDINLEWGGGNTARKPVPWSEGFGKYKLDYDSNPNRVKAYTESGKVIRFRTRHPELFRSKFVTTKNCGTKAVNSIRRIDSHWIDPEGVKEDIYTLVLGNFNAENTITIKGDFPITGMWYNVMTGEPYTVRRTDKTISLNPGELLILCTTKFDDPVGVEDEVSEENVSIFPTFTDDIVSINSEYLPDVVTVIDMAGNTVLSAANVDEISIAHLESGVYHVIAMFGNKLISQKVIKK